MDLKEISSKYEESRDFLQTRKKRQVAQLVLLNNLQRGDENIASTLLLTLFNRVLSSLYDDKIQIKFVPMEEVDQKRVNALNLLAQNDYREMGKAKLDYDWCWDTLFFGRGYMETLRYKQKRHVMEPAVINPLVFGYDPYFEEPKQWRYYWKWITKSKWELVKLIKDGTITGIKSVKEIPSGIDPYLWDYKVKREEAKKATPLSPDAYSGDVYQILEFYGYKDDGEKYIYWLDKNFSKLLMEEKLDLQDAEDGSSDWPVVVKEAMREPHSSVIFSVADLLEDKHRAKSVLLNLAFIAAKDKANPLYGYNPDKVRDITQFFSRQINQHIPMDDVTAAWPLNTQEPMSSGLLQFISLLTQEANEPLGTGVALDPIKKGSRTATETAITQQLNDMAQSLNSKVMQFGEQEFWLHWYNRHKRYGKKGDEKIATITGVKGMTFEKIDLGDIHTKNPPGIMVYSAKEAEYKELVLRRDLMELYPALVGTLDQDGLRNFNKHVFFPKFLDDPSLIDLMIPDTLDEIKAKEENEVLAEGNRMPDVLETDNHAQHIYIHYMAKKTWATWVHIAWHEDLLAQQKQQQMMMGMGMMAGEQPQMGNRNQINQEKSQPVEAAIPLKNEALAKGQMIL